MMGLLVRLNVRGKRGAQQLPGAAEFLAELPWRREHKPPRPPTPAEFRAKADAVMRMLGGKRHRGAAH